MWVREMPRGRGVWVMGTGYAGEGGGLDVSERRAGMCLFQPGQMAHLEDGQEGVGARGCEPTQG